MVLTGLKTTEPGRKRRTRSLAIREVVLYGDGPDEFTSARVTVALHRRGSEHLRPLAGGIRAWRERGFPLALA